MVWLTRLSVKRLHSIGRCVGSRDVLVYLDVGSAGHDFWPAEVFEDVVEASRAGARPVGDDGKKRGYQDSASEPVLRAHWRAGMLSGGR